MTDQVSLTLRLPADLHELARLTAVVEDRSLASLVRAALRQYTHGAPDNLAEIAESYAAGVEA